MHHGWVEPDHSEYAILVLSRRVSRQPHSSSQRFPSDSHLNNTHCYSKGRAVSTIALLSSQPLLRRRTFLKPGVFSLSPHPFPDGTSCLGTAFSPSMAKLDRPVCTEIPSRVFSDRETSTANLFTYVQQSRRENVSTVFVSFNSNSCHFQGLIRNFIPVTLLDAGKPLRYRRPRYQQNKSKLL